MIDGLLNVLNELTDVEFVEEAWSHSPTQKYGVITLDGQKALKTGKSMISEKMLRGYVDVFEKKPKSLNTPNSVEAALSRLGIYFNLESVQFEEDTGYVHWEWRWVDTLNVCSKKMYVCRFHAHNGYIGEPQIVPIGGHVVVPTDTIPDYTENGITYHPTGSWTPGTLSPVLKNTVYEKPYYTDVTVKTVNGEKRAFNGDNPFTTEQIGIVKSFFDNGGAVACVYNGGLTRESATEVTTRWVVSASGTAVWYAPEVWIEGGKAYKSAGVPFTSAEINSLVSWFDDGNKIVCLMNNGITRANAETVDSEKITWNIHSPTGSAPWAV